MKNDMEANKPEKTIRDVLVTLSDKLRYRDEGEHYKYKDIKQEIDDALTEIRERLPKKIRPEHCDKHRKVLPWSCSKCGSYFTYNLCVSEIDKAFGKGE